MGIDLWKDSDLQLPYCLQSLFSFGKLIELCHDNDVFAAALDAGVNYIDTAEHYARGNSERTIGQVIKNRDRKKLFITGNLYCRHACGECEPHCPHEVPVNTIMRYQHYFMSQGREKQAMEKYAALQRTSAAVCTDCEGHCEAACPFGVKIQGLLMAAHQTLSLDS